MNKIMMLLFLLTISIHGNSQMKAQIDKKSKEFTINPGSDPKAEYKIFGYQFPNATTKLMICFSSYRYDVTENVNKCPLGAYFDSGRMKEGDRILYLGNVGSFGKMSFISATGTKTLFYIPKDKFVIK
ncbi:MAG TPA: hypothetical protein VFI33_19335 [Puia sp.]|nr:hypothetical protein [Puia sp.]